MVVVPPAMAVTTPVDEPITAVAVALLLHVPPDTVLVSEVVEPTHRDEEPDMVPAVAAAFTVTILVTVPQVVM